MFKVIVAGGRDFSDYHLLQEKVDCALQNIVANEEIIIVSGKATGADSLGERYAKERGLKVKEFPANWEEYGRSAGPRRNEEMAMYAHAAIIFWDGRSKGTRSMIELAKKYKLKLKIYSY